MSTETTIKKKEKSDYQQAVEMAGQIARKKVLTTTDYKQFKQIAGNRVKNKMHAHNIMKSMMENYLFTIIIVNEKYEIIDGQHRFDAIQKLKLPVNFIICEGYGLREVHILNQNSKTWNSEDYLEGYCNLGLPDYIKYRKFKDKYRLGHSECQAILGGTTHRRHTSAFSTGDFKIHDYEGAVAQIEKIFECKKYYSGYRRRSFIYTMCKLMQVDGFSMDEFIHQLSINPGMIYDCARIEQYINLVEEIYNYKKSRNILHLRYTYRNYNYKK
jgi:hypothetical protein